MKKKDWLETVTTIYFIAGGIWVVISGILMTISLFCGFNTIDKYWKNML